MMDFYLKCESAAEEELLTRCAKAIFQFVGNRVNDRIGPFTEANHPNEKTISGVFAATLQSILTQVLFPADQTLIPDVLVAAEQKLYNGGIDATVYKRLPSGLHPRVLFEFATKQNEDKDPQLFAYVNNASRTIDNMMLLMTGCVVVMDRQALSDYRLKIMTYIKVRPPVPCTVGMSPSNAARTARSESTDARIADVLIYNGPWTVESVRECFA